jgi:hypothetical protein
MPLTFKTKCFETFMGIWASTVTLRPYDTMILSLTHWNLKSLYFLFMLLRPVNCTFICFYFRFVDN